MKPQQTSSLPDGVKDQIVNTPWKCPYLHGKMTLSQREKYSFDEAQTLIDTLKDTIDEHTTYKDLLDQCNTEKELQYALTHDMVQERMNVAYPYYLETRKHTQIDRIDIRGIAFADPNTLKEKLAAYFGKINTHIKNQFPEADEQWAAYHLLKDTLTENGVRKSTNGNLVWFDSLCETPIVTQLMINTIPYMQYLYSTHWSNIHHMINYTYDITRAKAPKFRFFSGQFGPMWKVRSAVISTLFHYLENNNMKNFYDDDNRYGMSEEAIHMMEEGLKATLGNLTPREFPTKADFFLPDENIYGCPVQDQFTKFYQMTLEAFLEGSEV